MEETGGQVIVYNPSEIFGMFSDHLARYGGKVTSLRGVFVCGVGKEYAGYYYDTLRDQFCGQEIGIRIPAALRETLSDGNLVELGGIIERKLNQKGYIQLTLVVTRAGVVQEQIISEDDVKRIELRSLKTERGYRNVDLLMESRLMADETLRVALVFAETSITDSDFNAGIEAASVKIQFDQYRVNFSNHASLVETLRTLDGKGYDAVALIRGGGSGIEQLDHLDVLQAVCDMSTPIICAVGHVEDKLHIKYLADKVASTPNGLGTYFKEMVETVSLKRSRSKEILTKQIEAQFKGQIEAGKKQNEELQKRLDKLTKESEEARKLSRTQIEQLNKSAEEGRKANEETFRKLNEQIAEYQKINKTQGEMFASQMKTMQEGSGKLQQSLNALTAKNNEYVELLSKSDARCRQLEGSLREERRHWIVVIVILLVVAAFAFYLIFK